MFQLVQERQANYYSLLDRAKALHFLSLLSKLYFWFEM